MILDKPELLRFLGWLPELEEHECFYLCLFARRKYHPSANNDKFSCYRGSARSREWLLKKIEDLSDRIFRNRDGSIVHRDSLCLYITPNPRSYARAQRWVLKKLADAIADGVTHLDPATLGMTAVHKAKSRTVYVDFDFDDIREPPDLSNIVNSEACSLLKTRGGYHVLVEPSKVHEGYRKMWYGQIKKLGADICGDNLIPVPGCSQGGFSPHFVTE